MGADFDLSAYNAAHGYGSIDGIERIDLDDGAAQALTFDFLDFAHLSDQNVAPLEAANALLILGDGGDTIHMGAGWTHFGDQTIGGTTFELYAHGDSVIGIDQDIGNVLP